MTVVPAEALAFHLGIAVYDIEASARRYEQIFGAMYWHRFEVRTAALPTVPETTDARVLGAYGRAAGTTFELVQVIEGESVHSLFLKRRGEGIQHLGIWVPDVQAAARRAVEAGARITMALLQRDGTGAVQLSALSSHAEVAAAVAPGLVAYADLGLNGVEIEFVGPVAHGWLKQMLGEDFERVVVTPAWLPPAG